MFWGSCSGENPFLLGIHCINHRLHLAVSKAAKDINNVNKLTTILSTIYQHVNNSPNRLQKFKTLADVLGALNDSEEDNPEEGGADSTPSLKYLKFKRVRIKLKDDESIYIVKCKLQNLMY